MNQSMQHLFSQIPRADIQRSVFDRHHTLKTAFDSGYLVPIFVDEVLPGDTFSLNLSVFGRLSTLAVPIMDNLYLETFFFAVPNRLIWDNWQRFCGEQTNPGDSTDYVVPTISPFTGSPGNIADYLGLPVNSTRSIVLEDVNALPFRAYNLIYNEWFRDENLIGSVSVPTDDGPDQANLYNLLKRRKAKDYFTGCLPWPQKGPGVEIPLAGQAPVYGDGSSLALMSGLTAKQNAYGSVATPSAEFYPRSFLTTGTSSDMGVGLRNVPSGSSSGAIGLATKQDLVSTSNPSGLYADLNNLSMVTINSLREAFQIQRMYETDARGGTRYTEILRAHFGVVSPDARLQRPEYLGGTSCRISVHPVSQQSATDSVTPQGHLAAFGTMGDVQHVFTKSFTEHCYIIGLANVRADLTYQQGIPRMFSRRTRFDFYWPTLAHLGEQAVLNKEIYVSRRTSQSGTDATAATAQDNAAFGYQERWAEYRYKPSMITGKMRSTVTDTLDVWHLAQKFDSLPALNQSFVEENVPLSRVLAVTNQPQIIFDADFDLKCARPMPVYSVPGLIDHF